MVKVTYDPREWEVELIFKNKDCPHLYYPANYHGCRLLHEDSCECNLEDCPHLFIRKPMEDDLPF